MVKATVTNINLRQIPTLLKSKLPKAALCHCLIVSKHRRRCLILCCCCVHTRPHITSLVAFINEIMEIMRQLLVPSVLLLLLVTAVSAMSGAQLSTMHAVTGGWTEQQKSVRGSSAARGLLQHCMLTQAATCIIKSTNPQPPCRSVLRVCVDHLSAPAGNSLAHNALAQSAVANEQQCMAQACQHRRPHSGRAQQMPAGASGDTPMVSAPHMQWVGDKAGAALRCAR